VAWLGAALSAVCVTVTWVPVPPPSYPVPSIFGSGSGFVRFFSLFSVFVSFFVVLVFLGFLCRLSRFVSWFCAPLHLLLWRVVCLFWMGVVVGIGRLWTLLITRFKRSKCGHFFYRLIRFIGQILAYKSYAALAAPGALLSRSEQSPVLSRFYRLV
jgi:hypothetical protein